MSNLTDQYLAERFAKPFTGQVFHFDAEHALVCDFGTCHLPSSTLVLVLTPQAIEARPMCQHHANLMGDYQSSRIGCRTVHPLPK